MGDRDKMGRKNGDDGDATTETIATMEREVETTEKVKTKREIDK